MLRTRRRVALAYRYFRLCITLVNVEQQRNLIEAAFCHPLLALYALYALYTLYCSDSPCDDRERDVSTHFYRMSRRRVLNPDNPIRILRFNCARLAKCVAAASVLLNVSFFNIGTCANCTATNVIQVARSVRLDAADYNIIGP
jgi:hypothetical protein